MISPAGPGALIGRGEQRIDLRTVRNWTNARVKRLLGMTSTRWICAEWSGTSNAAYRKKEWSAVRRRLRGDWRKRAES